MTAAVKRRFIMRAWKSYRDSVIKRGTPSNVVHSCELSFFSGAWAFASEILLSSGDDPKAATREMLEEVQNFGEQMIMCARAVDHAEKRSRN